MYEVISNVVSLTLPVMLLVKQEFLPDISTYALVN